jgi:hypothetical protein
MRSLTLLAVTAAALIGGAAAKASPGACDYKP